VTKRKEERTPKQISQERKLAASIDGRAAMVERTERAAFVEKNTARLRALRLAKEAQDAAEALAAPPAPPVKQKRAAKS
jgi:hypothetical protein